MQTGDNPYEILGVKEDAETGEIRKAYRSLAVLHHPDKQPTEEGREKAHHIFARIACAYELLSDDEKRKEYHEQQEEAREAWDSNEEGSYEPPGFDGNATYDYPFEPRNAGSTALVHATDKTGKKFNPFRRKKQKKPFHFSDPYEVFKRAFKEEFGYEYPGAKWDNIDKDGKAIFHNAKNAPLAIENGGHGDKDTGGKKKGGGILSMFRGKKSEALTVYDDKKAKEKISSYKQPPGNNRPTSMETKTHKIEHPDGSIETITETIITRPDGSTESSRTTDMPEKGSRNWSKPKEGGSGADKGKPLKQLTSGKEKQKMLTNGGAKKKKPEKKQLAIANG